MQFQGSAAFQPLNDPSVVNSQSYDAHQPPFAQPIQFTIAGTGQLPEDTAQGADQSAAGSGPQAQTASNGPRPGGGLGAPIDPEGANDPWSKYKWLILGGLGLALFAGAGFMLKSGQPAAAPVGLVGTDPSYPATEIPAPVAASAGVFAPGAATPPSAITSPAPGSLLQALKEELFALETDRLAGRLSESEYAQHKDAFDLVLRRALARIEP
jgi:hypothetical protein